MSKSFRPALVLMLISALTLAACATSVNRILADPLKYRDREVTVAGRVVDSVSLVGRGAFRLEDRSGSLWVISDVGVPRTGARVKVTGRIQDTFDFSIFGGRIGVPGRFGSGLVMRATRTRAD